MVDRQSKHIPPAIHGLPSEINPFWLVLPDQEVVYRTYTAPFTLSTVLPLVFQPFKINKPPGVHFPRISCSGVNPATHEFTAYLRILTSTDKHFIYETFSALREFVPVKCIYRLLLFIYYFVFMITESYEIEFAWSCADVQKMFWQRLMITAKLYELGLLQKKKKNTARIPSFLIWKMSVPLYFYHFFFPPSTLSYCKCNMNLRISRGFHNKSFFSHHRSRVQNPFMHCPHCL